MTVSRNTLLSRQVDDVAGYIFHNYNHLFTREEISAYMITIYQAKQDHSDNPGFVGYVRAIDHYTAAQPGARALLQDGKAAFYRKVTERILREHTEVVFLNRCPKCNTLCRTPDTASVPLPQSKLLSHLV